MQNRQRAPGQAALGRPVAALGQLVRAAGPSWAEFGRSHFVYLENVLSIFNYLNSDQSFKIHVNSNTSSKILKIFV
jgi:hypothetical protein